MKDQECMRHDCLNDGLSLSVLVICISCVVFFRSLLFVLCPRSFVLSCP
jgi:hypothetical protein